MKHYVQLKDGVVFAYVETANEIPTSDSIIEVESEGSLFLNKSYVDGIFLDPEKIKYAIVDTADNNVVVNIKETYFVSELQADGGVYLDPQSGVKVGWFWNGERGSESNFLNPLEFAESIQQPVVVENSPGE